MHKLFTAAFATLILASGCADEAREVQVTSEADTDPVYTPPLLDGECLADEDCAMGLRCSAGVCVEWVPAPGDTCVGNPDCPDDKVCETATGLCVTPQNPGEAGSPDGVSEPDACLSGQVRTCGVSKIGACKWGVEVCAGTRWSGMCTGAVYPANETCNGVDDDCNGFQDDIAIGPDVACPTGRPGVCAAGRVACELGWRVCKSVTEASSERCDNQDNDCDGLVDDGNPGGGASCTTTLPGECVTGAMACAAGVLACAPATPPASESCDMKDNDCDGMTDEDANAAGTGCGTGLPGICGLGGSFCGGGIYQCQQTTFPGYEICNGLDDDCDTTTDEGLSGAVSCTTGLKGMCAAGVMDCRRAQFVCTQLNQPGQEICDGLDNNCDGRTDELFDEDRDGYAVCRGDCDDQNPLVHTGRREACDSIDNNCDGQIDEGMIAPIADAGSDRTVAPPTLVLLSAGGSFSPTNSSLTYKWTLVRQPTGSPVSISGTTSANASFMANGAGDYVFDLQVFDTNGCRSEHDQVTIHAVPIDDVHVELTWDHEGDVDLHYLAPGGTIFAPSQSYTNGQTGCGARSSSSDCNYLNKEPDWGRNASSTPDCLTGNDPALDVDNTTSYGPENVNQNNPFDGTYRVNVHYYCARTYGPTVATVKVWNGGVLRYTASKTLSNRQNWDALQVKVVGGVVTEVVPASGSVTQISQGCTGY